MCPRQWCLEKAAPVIKTYMAIVENYCLETVLSYKKKTQLISSTRVPLIGMMLGQKLTMSLRVTLMSLCEKILFIGAKCWNQLKRLPKSEESNHCIFIQMNNVANKVFYEVKQELFLCHNKVNTFSF